MSYLIRSLLPTGALAGELPYDNEHDARAAFRNLRAYAAEKGNRLELLRDGEVIDSVGRVFAVDPDGNVEVKGER